MWPVLLGWTVAGAAVTVLIGIGFSVLSMNPPHPLIAQACFTVAASILMCRTAWWIVVEQSIDVGGIKRGIVAFLIFGFVGAAWTTSITWVRGLHAHSTDGSANTANYPDIEFKESDQYIFQAGYVTVTIACFRNDAVTGQDLPFCAQIIYKNAAENEIANVARGTWFPTNSSHPTTTTFATGAPRNLGIFFFNDGKFFKPVMEWIRESLVGLIPRITFEEFTEKIVSVEIRFLSGTQQPRTFILDVSDYQKDRLPTLLLRRD